MADIKFMLASDWDESKQKFPVIAQPKIDGVRLGQLNAGRATGRSLKAHKNKYTTAHFSLPQYYGMDMEITAERPNHPDLCRLTSGAVSRIEGLPYTLGFAFDYITPATINLPYRDRLARLVLEVNTSSELGLQSRVRVIEWRIANNMAELLACDDENLANGYEGTIVRDPEGKYKQGRSTVREGGLLRIKRFIVEEARVVSITEGRENQNEAQINELGNTFRSSHQENKVPNGMVGSMECDILKDSDLFKAGQRVTISKGEMTSEMAKDFFENQHKLVGQVIKFKHFPKGVKDKPRFPTFQTIRAEEDIE